MGRYYERGLWCEKNIKKLHQILEVTHRPGTQKVYHWANYEILRKCGYFVCSLD